MKRAIHPTSRRATANVLDVSGAAPRNVFLWCALLACALLGCALVAPGALTAQEAGTTQDGIYTPEQAERGKEVYTRVCSECHPLDWYQGDLMRAWAGAPVFIFYDVIRATMPQNNPGSLPDSDYAAMLAYILELNGMPAGEDPLSPQASALSNIVFEWGEGR